MIELFWEGDDPVEEYPSEEQLLNVKRKEWVEYIIDELNPDHGEYFCKSLDVYTVNTYNTTPYRYTLFLEYNHYNEYQEHTVWHNQGGGVL